MSKQFSFQKMFSQNFSNLRNVNFFLGEFRSSRGGRVMIIFLLIELPSLAESQNSKKPKKPQKTLPLISIY